MKTIGLYGIIYTRSRPGKEVQKVNLRKADHKAMDAAKQARNAYAREWRARNPDKVRKYNMNYWERKAAKQTETRVAVG